MALTTSYSPKTKTVYAIILIVGLVLFYLIRWQAPQLVTSLYQNKQTAVLNLMTWVSEEQSLDFYLGRSQETVFGPLTQLISGLLLVGAGLIYFQNSSRLIYFLAILAYLLLTKFEVLFFPPYGDAIGGPFAEAYWLKNNGFNYLALFAEDGYAWGGPKVYMFSIFPTYIALLMKLIPHTPTFLFISHLIVFMMVSLMVALLRDIFVEHFSKEVAILGSLVLLFLPLFQSQTEAINMEMPCAFFMLFSAYFLMKDKFHWAAMMAIFAVLVKGTGVVACGTFIVYALTRFFKKTDYQFNLSLLIWAAFLAFFSVLKIMSKFVINDQHVSKGMVNLFTGWPSLIGSFTFYLYMFCFAVLIIAFLNRKKLFDKEFARMHLTAGKATWVMFSFAGLWFLLFLNFYAVSPRYKTTLYPFLVFCILCIFALLVKNYRIKKTCLVIVIILSLLGSYGMFYKPMTENDHVLLERTLEYRNDMFLNMKVVKRLEYQYNRFTIGAPFVIAHLLAIPEYGYTLKDLDVMLYGFKCNYADIREFEGINKLDVNKTIYVGVKVIQVHKDFSYPISPHDKIVETIRVGNKRAWLFLGGVALDSVLRAMRMMMLEDVYMKTQ